MDLLPQLVRAEALESVLSALRPGSSGASREAGPRPVTPALPGLRALRTVPAGAGDVFSVRSGSPAAALAAGLDPVELARQAAGRSSAPAAGRDPGGFPTDLDRGALAPVDVPGVLLEVLAGIALSFRLRGQDRVALLVDDLPGSDAGDWHEGLSFAVARRVPLVVVMDAAGAGERPDLEARAPGYGVAVHTVWGQDPRAVEHATWKAVEAARSGGGVQLVQVLPPASDPVDWLAGALAAAGSTGPSLDELRADAREWATSLQNRVLDEPEPGPEALDPGTEGLLPRARRGWTVHARPRAPYDPPMRQAGVTP